jgi:hypothetical protein
VLGCILEEDWNGRIAEEEGVACRGDGIIEIIGRLRCTGCCICSEDVEVVAFHCHCHCSWSDWSWRERERDVEMSKLNNNNNNIMHVVHGSSSSGRRRGRQ